MPAPLAADEQFLVGIVGTRLDSPVDFAHRVLSTGTPPLTSSLHACTSEMRPGRSTCPSDEHDEQGCYDENYQGGQGDLHQLATRPFG